METCLLTEAEKIKLCELVSDSGADYIKTSTGFSTGGATLEDVALFKAHRPRRPQGTGGISSLRTPRTSWPWARTAWARPRIVKLVKGEHAEGY